PSSWPSWSWASSSSPASSNAAALATSGVREGVGQDVSLARGIGNHHVDLLPGPGAGRRSRSLPGHCRTVGGDQRRLEERTSELGDRARLEACPRDEDRRVNRSVVWRDPGNLKALAGIGGREHDLGDLGEEAEKTALLRSQDEGGHRQGRYRGRLLCIGDLQDQVGHRANN